MGTDYIYISKSTNKEYLTDAKEREGVIWLYSLTDNTGESDLTITDNQFKNHFEFVRDEIKGFLLPNGDIKIEEN